MRGKRLSVSVPIDSQWLEWGRVSLIAFVRSLDEETQARVLAETNWTVGTPFAPMTGARCLIGVVRDWKLNYIPHVNLDVDCTSMGNAFDRLAYTFGLDATVAFVKDAIRSAK